MQLKKTQKSKSAGFTLIELLIVIIIIGILAAIAFVAYSGSQNKAKKASAESTLSQVRSKLAEYNSDKGYYPMTIGEVTTYLKSPEGGNNKSLGDKFVGPDFIYAPDPSGCDNATTTTCSGYTATAKGSVFSGSDIVVTN